MRFFSEKHFGCGDFATFYQALSFTSADKPAAVCKLLDIKPATLQNYLKGLSCPPHAATRLLFMESFYGLEAINMQAANGLSLARTLSNGLTSEVARLRAQVQALEVENGELKQHRKADRDIAANAPRWRA